MEKRITPGTPKTENQDSDTIFDTLISQSLSRLDSSPGLPYDFARRTAMLAAARARQEREREDRRERLLARVVPVVCVVAAVVALVIVTPGLPAAVAMSVGRPLESILSGMDVSPHVVWMAGAVTVVGAMLAGLNAVLRRVADRHA